MTKINKHIEIVRTTKSHLSSLSVPSAEAIKSTLSKHYSKVGITNIDDYDSLENLVSNDPDLIFLGMKGIPRYSSDSIKKPKDVWLSNYFNNHEIAYTGSNYQAHKLEVDKAVAKNVISDSGLETSPFLVIKVGQKISKDDISLSYPLFIKPLNRGGGLGIDNFSVANTFSELIAKVDKISTSYGSDSIVEEYLPGREFSVAILKETDSDRYDVMPIELIAPKDTNGRRYLSSIVKSLDKETFHFVEDSALKSSISELALNSFLALGARDYGRIDIRLDKEGNPQFLEANLIPSLMENYGNFSKACNINIGLNYEKMLLQIVNLSFARDKSNVSSFSNINPEPVPQIAF